MVTNYWGVTYRPVNIKDNGLPTPECGVANLRGPTCGTRLLSRDSKDGSPALDAFLAEVWLQVGSGSRARIAG